MADPEVLASTVGVLRAVVRDVEDVLESIAVAGLAALDADLPDEVAELAVRAGDSGLQTGAAGLAALEQALRGLGSAQADRGAGWQAAGALHEVIAWSRMVRRELDLAEVEIRAVRGEREARPSWSRRVWPLGLELRGAHLTLWALDGEGRPVLLLDQLVEHQPSDPLEHPSISRLFQEVVRLREVLQSGVELVDHPDSGSGQRPVFAPAFGARPRVVPRTGPPPDPGPLARGGPGWIELDLEHTSDGVEARLGEQPVELVQTAVLQGTLTKWLIRQGAPRAPLRVVAVRRQQRLSVLAAEDPEGERVFPAVDPRAFPLPRDAVLGALDGVARVLVGAAICEDPGSREGLVAELGRLRARDPLDAVRLELASRTLTGMPAAVVAAEVPDARALAQALQGTDDRQALAALWLGAGREVEGVAGEALARRSGPLEEGDPCGVALQALLRVVTASEEEERQAARGLLASHAASWRTLWSQPDQPLPDVEAMLLASLVAVTLGMAGDRQGPILPPVRLWGQTVGRIYRQVVEGERLDRPIADGLWLLAGGGLEPWVVS